MMLNFELRSFATDYLVPQYSPADRAEMAGGPADLRRLITARRPRYWRSTTGGKCTGGTGKWSTTKAGGGSHEANFLEA